jgi:hypothetical protein
MNERQLGEQRFYEACASLLGASYDYRPYPFQRPNRWNNRVPGNGRFIGHGVIRLFGERVHMQLRRPRLQRWFNSREEALEALARAVAMAPGAASPIRSA